MSERADISPEAVERRARRLASCPVDLTLAECDEAADTLRALRAALTAAEAERDYHQQEGVSAAIYIDRLVKQRDAALSQIDAAAADMRECCDCGGVIPELRRRANPAARRCVPCQSAMEAGR